MKKSFESNMFKTDESLKNSFLLQTKLARKDRASEKDRDNAARCIQKFVHSWLQQKKFIKQTL